MSGSWDLSKIYVQSTAMTGTGEVAGDLVSMGKRVSKVIRTGEEAVLNSSPQVPMSQGEGHELGKYPDAWKTELNRLKEVSVAHACTCNSRGWMWYSRRWVWHMTVP